mmetsp:Transcript_30559/g.50462  ORF Transcript_30559/g.50462 Transcript_30559/m.50462 type:complete len:500 (-) Transcript_30559:258-1757(-)|eukprot:CAMPEP_0119012260 /NCGR_PEP_ID=MMETSP1176-20130426/6180_1 /TAXON_ID=265551 /ORGANISM="Synedropsis recta cf, Strain CCMP1620" /LENGTH=499 /DNA_ID=CAMNT_0006965181 /DNA_START=60 /DNA_END=1559 /DNA_ORIENTATION=-
MVIPKFLIALALVGVVDSVSYMVVAPSIVFYVLENGGTKEQYGIILSAFSFASFLAKPFVGYWADKSGFRTPYIICLALSSIGGLIYLIASAWNGKTAVALMLTARLLGGIGGASAALGFAYLAKVVPHDDQTKINSILSMTRIFGMATGPGFNVFLALIDTEWFGFHIDPLNSVGLVLICTNAMALLFVYFLLDEPEEDLSAPDDDPTPDESNGTAAILRGLMSLPILIPFFSVFSFNANFQLIETGLAPAANHALGWTPVGVSGILGSVSIVIFINMMIVFSLSARKVRDEYIIIFGAAVSIIGYFLIWDMWRWETTPLHFVLPIVLGVSSFPFLAAPTRSVFTKAVDRIEVLRKYQGSMQALLSMFASVAGFATPGLVAAYILRNPEEVENSQYHRELSPYALFAPLLMTGVLCGSIYLAFMTGSSKQTDDAANGTLPDEKTSLVSFGKGGDVKPRRFSAKVEVNRRNSAQLLGMVQASMYDEHQSLYDDEIDEEE